MGERGWDDRGFASGESPVNCLSMVGFPPQLLAEPQVSPQLPKTQSLSNKIPGLLTHTHTPCNTVLGADVIENQDGLDWNNSACISEFCFGK